jgi:hypothetical protein
MQCKCGNYMIYLIGDEYVELYLCIRCKIFVIKDIYSKKTIWLKEIEND